MDFNYALILLAATTASPNCSYDVAQLLDLPFEQFDQDMNGGWRSLKIKGCSEAAAEALSRYRNNHVPLTDSQRSVLLWHEGQIFAFMGRYERAMPLLLAGIPVDDTTGFMDYALGTVAFLRRDKRALRTARSNLAALPKPSNWDDSITTTVNGRSVVIFAPWPPNLNVLDGLSKCFNRTYSQAYFCRPLKIKAAEKSAR
ncbi:MAG: hypothetical protein HEQ34_13140 [Sphingorhabdus sp.]|uniref:hypothetical protein n=1 Tax=Sphingorhabdus sp. TaxID=1902408 RepID=UPI0025FB16A1|nr:hypothetical protein [Sphingorhabdus sp.]MCO4092878.1 hypothetical protein [Sphingorhabdus sp.]